MHATTAPGFFCCIACPAAAKGLEQLQRGGADTDSGARGDWRRDPDGDHAAAQLAQCLNLRKEEGRPSRWKDGLARSFVHGSTHHY